MEALRALCAKIDSWKAARGFSDGMLFRTISGLNDKTHGKIRRGEHVLPENHLAKYEAAWRECEAFDRRAEKEELLATLPPTEAVIGALESVKLNSGNDRFVLIEGESGAGKTTALRYAAEIFADCHYVTAHDGWEASPTAALGDIIEACGVKVGTGKAMPQGFAARQDMLIEALRKRPRMILIDEGQHAGPELNVLKDIINRTQCWVALATMSSLWRKIQTTRWAEVKQLLHNRMHLRVQLKAPDEDAVEMFLSARLALDVEKAATKAAQSWQGAFRTVTQGARGNGLYAFCRKVAVNARLMSYQDGRGGTIAPDDLIFAATAVAKNTAGFDHSAAA